MASKAEKNKTKVAPPRVSNEAREANFLRQTGLRSAHSAKQRRRLAAVSTAAAARTAARRSAPTVVA